MAEAFNRLLQAVRLQRDAFVWMDFNDRATGDALIFIGVTRVLLLLGFGGSILGVATSLGVFETFFRSLLNAVIFWMNPMASYGPRASSRSLTQSTK